MEDIEGQSPLLEVGSTYSLPLLPLDGVVLVPGETLPHRLLMPADRLAVRLALQAPPPVTRLLAVVCYHNILGRYGGVRLERVGCTVEVMKRSGDGVNIVAIARQRINLHLNFLQQPISLHAVPLSILPDAIPRSMPSCVRQGHGSHAPWVYRQADAEVLAEHARRLFTDGFTHARCFEGDPLGLSFWLIGNVPFDTGQRQELLEADDAAQRLTREITWLKELVHLYCAECLEVVASVSGSVQVSHGGVSGHYVNSHAVIHDVITTLDAVNVTVVGEPETDNSWFEGYSWQIVYCSCRSHLGWRFTKESVTNAADEESEVPCFFGLRRSAITNSNASPYGIPVLMSSEGESEEIDDQADG